MLQQRSVMKVFPQCSKTNVANPHEVCIIRREIFNKALGGLNQFLQFLVWALTLLKTITQLRVYLLIDYKDYNRFY